MNTNEHSEQINTINHDQKHQTQPPQQVKTVKKSKEIEPSKPYLFQTNQVPMPEVDLPTPNAKMIASQAGQLMYMYSTDKDAAILNLQNILSEKTGKQVNLTKEVVKPLFTNVKNLARFLHVSSNTSKDLIQIRLTQDGQLLAIEYPGAIGQYAFDQVGTGDNMNNRLKAITKKIISSIAGLPEFNDQKIPAIDGDRAKFTTFAHDQSWEICQMKVPKLQELMTKLMTKHQSTDDEGEFDYPKGTYYYRNLIGRVPVKWEPTFKNFTSDIYVKAALENLLSTEHISHDEYIKWINLCNDRVSGTGSYQGEIGRYKAVKQVYDEFKSSTLCVNYIKLYSSLIKMEPIDLQGMWEVRISMSELMETIQIQYVKNILAMNTNQEDRLQQWYQPFSALINYVPESNAGFWFHLKGLKKNKEVGISNILAASESLTMRMMEAHDKGKEELEEFWNLAQPLFMPCIKNKNEVMPRTNITTKTRLFANFNSCIVFWLQIFNNVAETIFPSVNFPREVACYPNTVTRITDLDEDYNMDVKKINNDVLNIVVVTPSDKKRWHIGHDPNKDYVGLENYGLSAPQEIISIVWNSWMSHWSPTNDFMPKLLQTMQDNQTDGSWFFLWYSDNLNFFYYETYDWHTWSIDGVKMEAQHTKAQKEAFNDFLVHCTTDSETNFSKVLKQFMDKVLMSDWYFNGYKATNIGLPSGHPSTSFMNSLKTGSFLTIAVNVFKHDFGKMFRNSQMLDPKNKPNNIDKLAQLTGTKMATELSHMNILASYEKGDEVVTDLLGFNMIKLEATESLTTCMPILRRESLVNATLLSKSTSSTMKIESKTAHQQELANRLQRVSSVYLMGGWRRPDTLFMLTRAIFRRTSLHYQQSSSEDWYNEKQIPELKVDLTEDQVKLLRNQGSDSLPGLLDIIAVFNPSLAGICMLEGNSLQGKNLSEVQYLKGKGIEPAPLRDAEALTFSELDIMRNELECMKSKYVVTKYAKQHHNIANTSADEAIKSMVTSLGELQRCKRFILIPCASGDYQEKLQKHISFAYANLQKFATKLILIYDKTSAVWTSAQRTRESLCYAFSSMYVSRSSQDIEDACRSFYVAIMNMLAVDKQHRDLYGPFVQAFRQIKVPSGNKNNIQKGLAAYVDQLQQLMTQNLMVQTIVDPRPRKLLAEEDIAAQISEFVQLGDLSNAFAKQTANQPKMLQIIKKKYTDMENYQIAAEKAIEDRGVVSQTAYKERKDILDKTLVVKKTKEQKQDARQTRQQIHAFNKRQENIIFTAGFCRIKIEQQIRSMMTSDSFATNAPLGQRIKSWPMYQDLAMITVPGITLHHYVTTMPTTKELRKDLLRSYLFSRGFAAEFSFGDAGHKAIKQYLSSLAQTDAQLIVRIYLNEQGDNLPLEEVVAFKDKHDRMVLTTDVIPCQKRFLLKHLYSETPIYGTPHMEAVINTLLVCVKKLGLSPVYNAPTAENIMRLQKRLKSHQARQVHGSSFNSSKQFDAIITFWLQPLNDQPLMVVSQPMMRLIEILQGRFNNTVDHFQYFRKLMAQTGLDLTQHEHLFARLFNLWIYAKPKVHITSGEEEIMLKDKKFHEQIQLFLNYLYDRDYIDRVMTGSLMTAFKNGSVKPRDYGKIKDFEEFKRVIGDPISTHRQVYDMLKTMKSLDLYSASTDPDIQVQVIGAIQGAYVALKQMAQTKIIDLKGLYEQYQQGNAYKHMPTSWTQTLDSYIAKLTQYQQHLDSFEDSSVQKRPPTTCNKGNVFSIVKSAASQGSFQDQIHQLEQMMRYARDTEAEKIATQIEAMFMRCFVYDGLLLPQSMSMYDLTYSSGFFSGNSRLNINHILQDSTPNAIFASKSLDQGTPCLATQEMCRKGLQSPVGRNFVSLFLVDGKLPTKVLNVLGMTLAPHIPDSGLKAPPSEDDYSPATVENCEIVYIRATNMTAKFLIKMEDDDPFQELTKAVFKPADPFEANNYLDQQSKTKGFKSRNDRLKETYKKPAKADYEVPFNFDVE